MVSQWSTRPAEPSREQTWFIPTGGIVNSTDPRTIVPVFNGDGGRPTHAVAVDVISTSAIAVTELRRINDDWVTDGTMARDASVTLTQTMTNISVLTAFAIENPVATSKRILFVVFNQASAAPDALIINSIDLSGGGSLSAVAVTIAGANAIPAADLVAAIGAALTRSTVAMISQDDFYQATITGDESGFTFTFSAAVVSAIDTSINVDTTAAANYSLVLLGSTLLLAHTSTVGSGKGLTQLSLWSISTAGVKIAEYLNVMAGFHTGVTANTKARLMTINGKFCLGSPTGNSGMGYLFKAVPLSDMVAN